MVIYGSSKRLTDVTRGPIQFSGSVPGAVKGRELLIVERSMQEVIRTIDALVQVEKTVGEFYGNCSEVFTNESEFWLALANEEFLHADVLAKLYEDMIREPLNFSPGEPFPLATLRAFVSKVQSQSEKLMAGTLTMYDALVAAYDIERTVIERKYLRAIRTEKPEYLQALNILSVETTSHRDRIKAKIDEYKKSGGLTGKDQKKSE